MLSCIDRRNAKNVGDKMKTNLKTFPLDYNTDYNAVARYNHALQWKEAFEAELRELLEGEDITRDYEWAWIIKEILGE